MIAFRVFGSISLTDEDGLLSGKPAQPKRIALLALLACHSRHTLSREKLMAFLWPESDEEQGRHGLSESLYVLRKALGEGVLLSEGDQVRLNPELLSCDVIAFRQALEDKNMEGAAALYMGPFLDGFFLKDAEEFNRWVESERQGLSDAYAGGLEALARGGDDAGDPLGAISWWTRLTAHDPYNSRFALGLMGALVQAGDPGNAIHHGEEHIRFLRDELGAEAPPEFLSFTEDLRNGGVPAKAAWRATEVGGFRKAGPFPSEGRRPSPPGPRLLWIAAAAAAMVLGSWAAYTSMARDPLPEFIQDLVVVPPFENRTRDPEMSEVGLLAAEWLEEEIQKVEGVQLVPSGFARGYAENQDGNGAPDPLRTLAERTRAGWVVGGTIQERGDSLELRVEVIDATRNRREQAVVEAGMKTDLSQILDRVARRVAGALAYEFDPTMREVEGAYQPLQLPPTIEAFREHRLGYQAFDRRDWDSSFRHHMTAYSLDTTLVRSLVAAAYMTEDHHVKDSLAHFADARRPLLSTQGRLDLDILLALLSGDHHGAYRAIQEIARREGSGFSSVLEASFAMRLNLPRAGLRATERYDPTLEWRRGEAHPYWVYRAQALHMLGDYERELAEAREGRERYPDLPTLLTAEVRALAALGNVKELWDRIHQTRAPPRAPRNVALVAGAELRAHGYLEASRSVFRQIVEWLRDDLAKVRDDPSIRLDLARALYGEEAWAEARDEAGALLAQEAEDMIILGLLGCACARAGDTAQAEAALDRLSGMKRPDQPGEHLYQMAAIAAALGRDDEAMRLLYRAYAEGMPHGLRLHQEMDFESLREREDFIALVTPKG